MKRLIVLMFVLVIGLLGCSDSEEPLVKADGEEEPAKNELNINEISDDDVVATIHGHEITGKDLKYEMKRLELISLLQGEKVPYEEISPQVAIQEMIQNHMIEMMASEKGIAVNTIEQEERAEAVRAEVEAVEGYETVMEGIDEELFWSKEEARYEIILQAETIVLQLMEDLQESHPTYDEQALRFDALEDFDELIREMVAETEIEVLVAK